MQLFIFTINYNLFQIMKVFFSLCFRKLKLGYLIHFNGILRIKVIYLNINFLFSINHIRYFQVTLGFNPN